MTVLGAVCGASAYSWLLPLGGLWAISVLQAEGRASSAAVRMKLIAVVCDQPVQLVGFFCLFATKNNINLKFVEMIVWRHMIQSMKVISFPTLPLWPDHPAVTTSLVTATFKTLFTGSDVTETFACQMFYYCRITAEIQAL